MRKKIFTSAVLVLAMAFMTSCSSDDSSTNNNPGGGPNTPGGGNGDDTGGGNGDGDGDGKAYQYVQKILLEDITSASCVVCPLATFATEELAESLYGDRIISVAVHDNYDSSLVVDPFVIRGVNDLTTAIKLSGYPFIAWNRLPSIGGSEFQIFTPRKKVDGKTLPVFDSNSFDKFHIKHKLFEDNSPIGIKIDSDLTERFGVVNVNLKFGKNIKEELKYVIYIIEDGLVFQQANSTELHGNNTGQGRWENDFIHNQVVRATNNFLGDKIAASETVIATEFKASIDLTYKVENLEKVSVVVAVLNKNGQVLNAQKAKANTTQDYEIAK